MTGLGFVGAMMGLIALSWAFVRRTNARFAIFMIMWVMHIIAGVIYYNYVQTHDADTLLYYTEPYHFADTKTGTGTWFTIDFVQAMKGMWGGTYLDYFLLFQAVGFWGLTILARAVEEIMLELRVEQPQMLYLALFLPGLYFWTSAIGKDAPLFFGTALAAWSVLQFQRRYFWFGVALVTMFPFRPHIALIALVALAAAFAFDRRTHLAFRGLMVLLVAVGAIVVADAMQASLSVDVSSTSSVADFVIAQNQLNVEGGASLASAPFVVKLFSQLFRPFFVDANGVLGLIASFENLFLIIVFLTFVRQWRLLLELIRRIAFIRYAVAFTTILVFFLSAIFYNVGLGLRQKTMMMPTLIILYAVVVAVSLARRHAASAGSAQAGGGFGTLAALPR